MNGHGDYIDVKLRDVGEIAGRAVVLATLIRRAMLDVMESGGQGALPGDDRDDLFDRDGIRFDLLAWLKEQEPDAIEAADTELLATPVGELTEDDLDRCTDATDALGALMWAVGAVPALPVPWDIDHPAADLDLIPQPWDDVQAFHTGAMLREETEIAREREIAELWFWRAAFSVDGEPVNLEERRTIRTVAAEAAEAGLVETMAGDFAVDGEPYANAVPGLKDEILAGAAARLRALNWVCGFGDTWASAPLEVD